jgi:hypothetical protein
MKLEHRMTFGVHRLFRDTQDTTIPSQSSTLCQTVYNSNDAHEVVVQFAHIFHIGIQRLGSIHCASMPIYPIQGELCMLAILF